MKTLLALICCLAPAFVLASSASGKIEKIAGEYGNIETTLTQQDLDRLDLQTGDDFQLMHKEVLIIVHLGETYGDVEQGFWISFINWEGKLRIARNAANAAETLDAAEGDDLTISAIDSTNIQQGEKDEGFQSK